MRIAHSGRARISARRPRAMAECDRTGFWYSLDDMKRQFEWAGNDLIDTGLLVGPDQVDIPQDQFRTPILPADPYPRINPRISANVTGLPNVGAPLPATPTNNGFTQYLINGSMLGLPVTTQGLVLSQALAFSGTTLPPNVVVTTVKMGQMMPDQLLAFSAFRTFLLFYNPAQFPVQFALSDHISLGNINNLSIGPGEAFFWSNAQGLGQAYTGAVTAISPYGGNLPIWVWSDGGTVQPLGELPTSPVGLPPYALWVDNDGVLAITGYDIPPPVLQPVVWGKLPTVPTGLPPFIAWDNGGVVVVTGYQTPPPVGAPVIIPGLPTSPSSVPYSLWVNGGVVMILNPSAPPTGGFPFGIGAFGVTSF